MERTLSEIIIIHRVLLTSTMAHVSYSPSRIRGLSVRDIRFPTSLELDGSDAIVSGQWMVLNPSVFFFFFSVL